MWPNPQSPADLVTFTGEILDGKLHYFRSVKKLLIIGCISPIGSTEAKRAASEIRRWKTLFHSTMGEQQESNLKLLLSQWVQDINIHDVVASFIKKKPRRLRTWSILFDW